MEISTSMSWTSRTLFAFVYIFSCSVDNGASEPPPYLRTRDKLKVSLPTSCYVTSVNSWEVPYLWPTAIGKTCLVLCYSSRCHRLFARFSFSCQSWPVDSVDDMDGWLLPYAWEDGAHSASRKRPGRRLLVISPVYRRQRHYLYILTGACRSDDFLSAKILCPFAVIKSLQLLVTGFIYAYASLDIRFCVKKRPKPVRLDNITCRSSPWVHQTRVQQLSR